MFHNGTNRVHLSDRPYYLWHKIQEGTINTPETNTSLSKNIQISRTTIIVYISGSVRYCVGSLLSQLCRPAMSQHCRIVIDADIRRIPANTIHWAYVGSMLDQRLWRWPNIELTLGRCIVCTGYSPTSLTNRCLQVDSHWSLLANLLPLPWQPPYENGWHPDRSTS